MKWRTQAVENEINVARANGEQALMIAMHMHRLYPHGLSEVVAIL